MSMQQFLLFTQASASSSRRSEHSNFTCRALNLCFKLSPVFLPSHRKMGTLPVLFTPTCRQFTQVLNSTQVCWLPLHTQFLDSMQVPICSRPFITCFNDPAFWHVSPPSPASYAASSQPLDFKKNHTWFYQDFTQLSDTNCCSNKGKWGKNIHTFNYTLTNKNT